MISCSASEFYKELLELKKHFKSNKEARAAIERVLADIEELKDCDIDVSVLYFTLSAIFRKNSK